MFMISSMLFAPVSSEVKAEWKGGQHFKLYEVSSNGRSFLYDNQPFTESTEKSQVTISYRIIDVNYNNQTMILAKPPYTVTQNTENYSASSFVTSFVTNFIALPGFGIGSLSESKLYLSSGLIEPLNVNMLKNPTIQLFVEPDWKSIGSSLSALFSSNLDKAGVYHPIYTLTDFLSGTNTSFDFNGATKVTDIPIVLNQAERSWNFEYHTFQSIARGLAEYSFSFQLSYKTSGMLDFFSYKQIYKWTKPPETFGVGTGSRDSVLSKTLAQHETRSKFGRISLNSSIIGSTNPFDLLGLLAGLNSIEIGILLNLGIVLVLLVVLFRVHKRFPKKIRGLDE